MGSMLHFPGVSWDPMQELVLVWALKTTTRDQDLWGLYKIALGQWGNWGWK